MTKSQYSITPWTVSGSAIFDAAGRCVTRSFYRTALDDRNAEITVRAVNSYQALVEALEAFIGAHDENYVSAMADDSQRSAYDEAMDAARAALKLAKGA